MLFHARAAQQDLGPHAANCECVRCTAERTSREEPPETFAWGDTKLNVDKSTHGTLGAVRVPANTKFVGSYLDPTEEVSERVTAASKAYYKVKTTVSQESGVAKKLKLRLYEGTVKPTLVFSLWTTPLKNAKRGRTDRAHRRHLRALMGRYYKEDEPVVPCEEIYLVTDTVPISVELTERRWTLLGHVLKLPVV